MAPARTAARWSIAAPRLDEARELARVLGVSPLVAQLLLNRGVTSQEQAVRYLEPRLAHLRRPDGELEMGGFARAADRLEHAITAGERIGVFGDYDADGVTSCALMTTFLREVGAEPVSRVARRDAGYGFSTEEVEAFAKEGARLIVTCDLGTSDHEAVRAAADRGIDVVIVDHHEVPDRDPGALALINPHQSTCLFPYKGLASVGVTFYLAAALRTRLAARGWPRTIDPRSLLDLVAIGTIGDLAPLTEENRVLVRAGLEALGAPTRPGVRALIESAGLRDGVRGAADVGFRLGPRLNAPGRIGEARLALELLLSTSDQEARRIAAECEDANQRRQRLQESVLSEAGAQAHEQVAGGARALVVAGHGWHPGVVGIVAARLVEEHHRPAVVIALDGATGRGSARTVPGVHLYEALRTSADVLLRFGGHAQAAGLSIEARNLDRFRREFEETVARAPARDRRLELDAEVELDDLDRALVEELRRLEPFGVGNPEPLFALRGVALERSRVVGSGHLQVTLRSQAATLDGIGFHLAQAAPAPSSRVRAAVVPEIDTFRGERRLRLRVRAIEEETGPETLERHGPETGGGEP